MYGAALGDIIGSPFEFDRGDKTKNFKLFSFRSEFTDDTVMTVAIAEALVMSGKDASDDVIRNSVIDSMKKWGKKYPDSGFGGRFYGWVLGSDRTPYNSWGNGSAMRVSPVAFYYDTLERTREVARLTAEVTHNHPEGIKGAEATASVIFMAGNGSSKDEIRDYIISEFGYNLDRTLDEIRPTYHHVESCQETVPEAITAFLESDDFEDAIRNAVSLGGDTDTLGAICGPMAEAFYGIPDNLLKELKKRVPKDMLSILSEVYKAR